MNFKQQTFSWISQKCELKKTKSQGLGIFTNKDINKDELVSVIGGRILDSNSEKKSKMETNDYSLQIDNNFTIGPLEKKDIEYSCFFNHSCNPNIGIKGQLYLVAMRKIKKGEELCFDYVMTLDEMAGAKKYEMRCECGSKNCRQIIKEDDWKNPVLQKRYAGYFQWYLQEKINCLKNGKKYKRPYNLPKN
jgi:SET domain-containing protein